MDIILDQLKTDNKLSVALLNSLSMTNQESAVKAGDKKDMSSISNLAKIINDSGLDLSSSSASSESNALKFDLSFNSSNPARLNFSGQFEKSTRNVIMNLSFQFQHIAGSAGLFRTFNANLNLNATMAGGAPVNIYASKGDIEALIRKLMGHISKAMSGEKQIFPGAIMSKENVSGVAGVNKGQLSKILTEIINMAMLTERIRKAMSANNDAISEDEIINPSRIKESAVDASDEALDISDISLKVEEVKPEESSPDNSAAEDNTA